MDTVYFKGVECHTGGTLPVVGEKAPCYTLVKPDMSEVKCSDFNGCRVVFNIFPSLDTPVCAMTVRRFNELASRLDNTTVICISMDLPFAASRFCVAEGIDNVIVASAFRSPMFAGKFGIQLTDGPLAGLLARAVIVMDENRRVTYAKLVREITEEPDYDEVIKALNG
ncbi:MAG: thiol peroxidase [Muribaculaceae bacterium]|nr:thiol peroxidase [Muribaculaceae bacterium]